MADPAGFCSHGDMMDASVERALTGGRPGDADADGWNTPPRLTPAERAEAERVARRLLSELRAVIHLLPEPERSASAMARALHLDRATCQRLVAATRRREGEVEALVELPGVLGLRQFLDAAMNRVRARGMTPQAAAQFEAGAAAIDRLDALIRELGGSQRRLRARLAAEQEAGGALTGPSVSADDVRVRRALFHAAAAATGRWSDVVVIQTFIRPLSGGVNGQAMTEVVKARALIGHRARPDAVPLELGHTVPLRTNRSDESAVATLDQRPAQGASAGLVLESFCSRPLPRVVTRSEGFHVVHAVDVESELDAGADIVIADRGARPDKHPASLDPPIGELWNIVQFPARRMVFDVWLHRDLAAACQASVETHLWTPDAHSHIRARWSTRVPGGPRLQPLAGGPAGAVSDAWPRTAELTTHLFSQVGWSADEFVGYRCDVAYPLWRGGYCVSFDFTRAEAK